MSETPDEVEKRIDQLARKARLFKGASGSVGVTIVVSFLYAKYFKEQMDPNVAVVVATWLGGAGTAAVMCFKDFRALLCGYLIRKRIVRNRRRAS